MICTVVAFKCGGNGYPNISTFEDVEDARQHIAELADNVNAQLLVDYANIEIYKEKFEDLYEDLKQSRKAPNEQRNTIARTPI